MAWKQWSLATLGVLAVVSLSVVMYRRPVQRPPQVGGVAYSKTDRQYVEVLNGPYDSGAWAYYRVLVRRGDDEFVVDRYQYELEDASNLPWKPELRPSSSAPAANRLLPSLN